MAARIVTTARKALIVAYLFFWAAACLWVQWRASVREGERSQFSASRGYGPIWAPPKTKLDDGMDGIAFVSVDVTRLALEIAALTALAGTGLVVTARAK